MTAVSHYRMLVALWLLSTIGCAAPWRPAIQDIPSPAAARGSGGPQLTTFGGRTILSWVERKDALVSLKFAERQADGWSEPTLVASGTDWFINWADVPSVVRFGDGVMAAHWLRENGDNPEAYDLQMSFSKDEGKTWSPPTTPHHD